MTKIVTKLPVSAEDFKNFRENALKKMIAEKNKKIFLGFFDELKKVADKTFVFMKNKKVWFDRNNTAIYPKFDQFSLPKFCTRGQPSKGYTVNFEGLRFVAMSAAECQRSFVNGSGNPYLNSDGTFRNFPVRPNLILTDELFPSGGVRFFVSDGSSNVWNDGDEVTLVPIHRFIANLLNSDNATTMRKPAATVSLFNQ